MLWQVEAAEASGRERPSKDAAPTSSLLLPPSQGLLVQYPWELKVTFGMI